MKIIISVIVIYLLFGCSGSVQGFTKQYNDNWLTNVDYDFDNKFPLSIDLSNTDFPNNFSWLNHEGKDWATPARQQLMGDCGVFSAIGALESIIKIRENNSDINLDLSEQYILSCLPAAAMEYGKGCTYGVLPSNAYQYIISTSQEGNNHNGVTWESCFPYQASDFSQGVTIDQINNDWLEFLVPISDYGSIWNEGVIENTPQSIELIKNMIIQHGPSVAAMSITSKFEKWGYAHHDPEEIFPYSGERWIDQLSHGVVIVGWKDDISIGNGGYWICKNSWGSDWGYNGFFNIEYGACFTGVLFEWVDYNPDDFYWPLTAQTKDIYFGTVNENILFDASKSISAEDSIIKSYYWDFGDGNTGSSQSTYYSYHEEDMYLVNLTIIDDKNNTSTTSVNVVISSEPITMDIRGGFLKADIIIDNPSNFTINDIIYRVEPIDGAPIIFGKYSLAGNILINPGENIIPIGHSLFGFSFSVNFRITIGDILKIEKIYVIGPLVFAPE